MFNLISNILVIIGLASVGLFYYNDSQDKISDLIIEKENLISANSLCSQEIIKLKNNFEQYRKTSDRLTVELNKAKEYNNDLIDKLNRHDLTALTLKKPTLIETRVNDATQKVFSEIESITRN